MKKPIISGLNPEIWQACRDTVTSVDFNPNMKQLGKLPLPYPQPPVQEDPSLERHFKGHRDTVTSVDFNPNMKQLGKLPLLSHPVQEDPSLERHFKGHRDTVTSVNFNPYMKLLGKSGIFFCVSSGGRISAPFPMEFR